MRRVYLGLISAEGDQLGHLVRGVNMLMSYGSECRIRHLSSVRQGQRQADGPPLLGVVVAADTDLGPERLADLCREVEWALGAGQNRGTGGNTRALNVAVLPDHDPAAQAAAATAGPAATPGLHAGGPVLAGLVELTGGAGELSPASLHTIMAAEDFRLLCRQGQRDGAEGAEVIGEWPGLDG